MTEAIIAHNLCKKYGSVKAVDGLDLEVHEGEFFGFLGPNGAGKTTTIRMLTGILPPDEGTITMNNTRIGVLPESRGFYEWMTGAEYLHFFARLYSLRDPKIVAALLDQVGLTARGRSTIGAYSRGMRQRLGLARALINSPKILFLDEPTLGLDPQGQKDIQTLLRSLNREGVTIFYSSHLLNEVSALCSRIAILNRGRLVAQGTLDELRKKTGQPKNNLTDIFLTLTQ